MWAIWNVHFRWLLRFDTNKYSKLKACLMIDLFLNLAKTFNKIVDANKKNDLTWKPFSSFIRIVARRVLGGAENLILLLFLSFCACMNYACTDLHPNSVLLGNIKRILYAKSSRQKIFQYKITKYLYETKYFFWKF